MGSGVRLTVLGAGDAFSSGGRAQSAYLLEGSGTTVLIECGASVLGAFKRAGKDVGAVDTILVSHLHGDHIAGLPFLFLEYLFETPRSRPLVVAGPPGLEERAHALYRLMYPEAGLRVLPFRLEFAWLEPGRRWVAGPLEVLPFRVPHQRASLSLGLSIRLGGKALLFSGDSAWTEQFVELSRRADLFLCECSFFDKRPDGHGSYTEIAAQAGRLGCRLLLTHLGGEVLARASELSLAVARDGLVVEL